MNEDEEIGILRRLLRLCVGLCSSTRASVRVRVRHLSARTSDDATESQTVFLITRRRNASW